MSTSYVDAASAKPIAQPDEAAVGSPACTIARPAGSTTAGEHTVASLSRGSDYAALGRKIRSAGLLDRRPVSYAVRVAATSRDRAAGAREATPQARSYVRGPPTVREAQDPALNAKHEETKIKIHIRSGENKIDVRILPFGVSRLVALFDG